MLAHASFTSGVHLWGWLICVCVVRILIGTVVFPAKAPVDIGLQVNLIEGG
jgi:hypothetical protein